MIWDPGKRYRHLWTKRERREHGKLLKRLRDMGNKWSEEHPSPVRKPKKGKKHGQA